MRILHVISEIDPRLGGTSEAARVMMRYGPPDVQAEVVTTDSPGSPYLNHLGFPVHALGPGRLGYRYAPRLVPWLRANRHRFDGVILHGMWQHTGYAVWRTMAGRVPYFVFPHGMLDPYFKRAFPLKHLKKWPYWLAVDFWVTRGAARVLFTSEAEAQLASKSFWLHQWKPVVVPFGAEPSEGDPMAQREAFLQAHPHLRGTRFLLFLGRIHPKKGCDLLVEAFLKLAHRDPGLHLIMAGPDQQGWRAKLEARVGSAGLSSRVHWPGMLAGDVKWGAFYASEAFVLPSHQENFGIAVAEALSCGVPVLLSDQVNIAPEIALDNAGLIEPDTAEGTLRLLTRWLDSPPEARNALSAAAVDTFRRRYDMREGARFIPHLFRTIGAVR
ncbi:MAG: glycosyltransferase [Actinobacteria bacterium]|nr:glycosyltransferase [Actinomycetota bacterium]